MGLVKISELPNLTTGNVSNNDFIPVVDIPPSGTTRTKKMLLQDLFEIAPVKSVNGLTTGDVSLASTHLTDASTIGRILNINGFSSGNVSLGSSDLTNGSDIAHHSDLGSVQGFTNEYNNPTTAQLQTEYEELARLLGTDQNNLRVSLFAVQQTADSAMPTTTANSTFATKVSLGEFTKSIDIIANHYTKSETDAKYATQLSLGNYTTSSDIINAHYTKTEVDTLIANNSGTASSNFEVNHLVADSASIATFTKSGSLQTTGNVSVGSDLIVDNNLSSLRADIGDGTSSAVGTSSTLFVDGNAYIKGTLVSDALEILGSTKIKNTQVVEVSDDFILLNKDNPTTSGGGIQVYQSSSSDLASLEWDEVNQIWNFKIGGQLASIGANNLGGGSVGNIPASTDFYSFPSVSINSVGDTIEVREQVSLGLAIDAYPVESNCCSISWGSHTDLTNLRAQVMRNTNTICTGVNMFNMQKGFEYAEREFRNSLNAPTPLGPGDFVGPVTEITTTITPTGTGGGSTQVSIGSRDLTGSYINFYLDSSGSMNHVIPQASNAIGFLQDYLKKLYFDNSSEAGQFISSSTISNERWCLWLASQHGDRQINIALINESHVVYHSMNDDYLTSPSFDNDHAVLVANYNLNQGSGGAQAGNFFNGIVFGYTKYPRFVNHLDHVFGTYALPGVERENNISDDATEYDLADYFIKKLNLPDEANKTNPELIPYDSGLNANQVQWTTSAYLQNVAGRFDTNFTDNFDQTMSGWEIEVYNVLADGTKNFQALINLGTKLPTNVVYQTLGTEPTKSFSARLIAKSNNDNPDGISAYADCSTS